MHIGIIGGIGPAATEFYYRGLIARHTKAGTELDLTIVHADVREMSQNLANRDAKKQAAIFARLIERLYGPPARLKPSRGKPKTERRAVLERRLRRAMIVERKRRLGLKPS